MHRLAARQRTARTARRGLLGRGRRSRWRRAVLRRVLAAALAAGAVALTVSATRPAPAAGTIFVVVAAHDIAAGATIAGADVTSAAYPVALRPPGALADPARATGRQVAAPILGGEVVTSSRLVPPGAGATAPGGHVAVHLIADDPAALDLLSPGTRATLYPAGGGPPLTRDALVLAVDREGPADGSMAVATGGSARGIVVALAPGLVDRIFAGQRLDGGPPMVSVAATAP